MYGEGHLALGVAERNQAWHENRQKKIEAMKLQIGEQIIGEATQECTFRPKIN